MAKSKFYAVKEGRTKGIYFNWEDCKAQVDGYQGAQYKSFKSMDEAYGYLRSDEKAEPKKVPEVKLPDGPYTFVDGSFNPDTGTYGYGGFVMENGRMHVLSGSGSNPDLAGMRNVAGEIEGSMAAVRKAEELGLKDMTILYDYRGIEEWSPQGTWKASKPGTKDYQAFMADPNRTVAVSFQHVDAHTGIPGNEFADCMAKKSVGIALTGPQKQMVSDMIAKTERNGIPMADVPDGISPELSM